MMAKKSLVTRPSGSELGVATGASTLRETAFAAHIEHIPLESADAPAACLKTISLRALDLPDSQGCG